METNAMEVKNLSFSYGSNQILSDISLTIPRGKITTIMGANGCGKSTLFSLMTKNLTPGKGKILLEEKSIKKYSLSEFARKVSIVHQHNSAAEDITIERLVSYGRTPYQKMLGGKSEEDERLIEQALQVTGLLDLRDREIGRLSGGQRQRVWIAMALAQNTELLFLDEPTTYLDIRYQLEILELVKKLNKEFDITIVMVLHDINQTIYFSDKIIGLQGGHVAIEGAPDQVITEESIQKLAAFLEAKSAEYGHPIYLIVDEPYRELVYGDVEVPYLTKYYKNTLVCYSYSKSLSLPGERIGYVLVPDEVDDARTIYAAVCGAGRALGFVCAPSLIQHVIAKCAGQVSDLSVYKKNRDLLYDSLTAYGFTCVHPDGAFYLFMKTPEPDAYAFCEKAKKYELLLVPGDDFGAPGFVRIAYCVTTAQIERALPAFKELAGEYFA